MNFKILFSILFVDIAISSSSKELETEISRKKQSNISLHKDIENSNINVFNMTQTKRDFPVTPFEFKTNKKWQIRRVTNKQYEMINWLWQKTKIFIDLDYSNLICKASTTGKTPALTDYVNSTSHAGQQALKTSSRRTKLRTCTPSYIEFNYLEETDVRTSKKPSDFILQKTKNNNNSNANRTKSHKFLNSSLKIHVNTILQQRHITKPIQNKIISKTDRGIHVNIILQQRHITKPVQNKIISKTDRGNVGVTEVNNSKPKYFSTNTPSADHLKSKRRNEDQFKKNIFKEPFNVSYLTTPVSNVTKPVFNVHKTIKSKNSLSLYLYPNQLMNGLRHVNKSVLEPASESTAYDRIKFFEIYDNNTPDWPRNNESKIYNRNAIESKNLQKDERIVLEHVNEDTGHEHDKNKAKFVKKHINNLHDNKETTKNDTDLFTFFSRYDLEISSQTTQTSLFQTHPNISRLAAWSEYPFVAVYIYEPSQVRCDAASLSPHWLLASASCLSRHHNDFHGGSLSAFVVFCSEDWTHPDLISYVKRTLIHPRYHPRDRTRRYLFNVGVIQVVNSMEDTCTGWAPVSLISHQFTADLEGTVATTVGWGLDRYDQIYTNTHIPKNPLMVYESSMYSQSCPGNFEYRVAKTSDEDGIRNVYCVSLPPYLAEENDTVHGALLLIGGKLLALYLQEERRSWGVQSAQYTGVWRLVPWIADVAREPDDLYAFLLDI